MRHTIIICAPLLLAACHGSMSWSGSDQDKDVHIAMNGNASGDAVSLDLPGVKASISLPGIDVGKHVDLDGIKLAPDTHVGSIDVHGHDGATGDGDGRVQMSFKSPMTPAALADYYRAQAQDAGYGDIAATPDAVTATKDRKRFALAVASDGSGSKGTIIVSGKD